ncbi:DUF4825 domain-containing protein [Viridibacillus arvi]|uniref:DUF4825 domain-containing protein n=1 Tax=Viridibacillus arvi TaxID=263475 RepID=UPI0036EC6AA7
MKRKTGFFLFSLLILLSLNGCNSREVNEDIFQYKASYVGDNSTVGNIVKLLLNSEYLDGFELKTIEEPYGILINYKGISAEDIEKNYKETAIYNATFIFTLVKNAKWITFNFDDQEYKITKQELESWYGKELSEYMSEEDLTKLTQKYLKDENKVNQFFEK